MPRMPVGRAATALQAEELHRRPFTLPRRAATHDAGDGPDACSVQRWRRSKQCRLVVRNVANVPLLKISFSKVAMG